MKNLANLEKIRDNTEKMLKKSNEMVILMEDIEALDSNMKARAEKALFLEFLEEQEEEIREKKENLYVLEKQLFALNRMLFALL